MLRTNTQLKPVKMEMNSNYIDSFNNDSSNNGNCYQENNKNSTLHNNTAFIPIQGSYPINISNIYNNNGNNNIAYKKLPYSTNDSNVSADTITNDGYIQDTQSISSYVLPSNDKSVITENGGNNSPFPANTQQMNYYSNATLLIPPIQDEACSSSSSPASIHTSIDGQQHRASPLLNGNIIISNNNMNVNNNGLKPKTSCLFSHPSQNFHSRNNSISNESEISFTGSFQSSTTESELDMLLPLLHITSNNSPLLTNTHPNISYNMVNPMEQQQQPQQQQQQQQILSQPHGSILFRNKLNILSTSQSLESLNENSDYQASSLPCTYNSVLFKKNMEKDMKKEKTIFSNNKLDLDVMKQRRNSLPVLTTTYLHGASKKASSHLAAGGPNMIKRITNIYGSPLSVCTPLSASSTYSFKKENLNSPNLNNSFNNNGSLTSTPTNGVASLYSSSQPLPSPLVHINPSISPLVQNSTIESTTLPTPPSSTTTIINQHQSPSISHVVISNNNQVYQQNMNTILPSQQSQVISSPQNQNVIINYITPNNGVNNSSSLSKEIYYENNNQDINENANPKTNYIAATITNMNNNMANYSNISNFDFHHLHHHQISPLTSESSISSTPNSTYQSPILSFESMNSEQSYNTTSTTTTLLQQQQQQQPQPHQAQSTISNESINTLYSSSFSNAGATLPDYNSPNFSYIEFSSPVVVPSNASTSPSSIHSLHETKKINRITSKFLKKNRTEQDIKECTCDICFKVFGRKYDYIRHRRIHTGDKPYVCKICNTGFTRSDHLNRHIKKTACGKTPYYQEKLKLKMEKKLKKEQGKLNK